MQDGANSMEVSALDGWLSAEDAGINLASP